MDKLSLPEFDGERAMHLSLGAVSPLWFVYAGAGAAGAAYYWMSRWYAATNIEAMTSFFEGPPVAEAIEVTEAVAETVADPVVEALPEPVAAVIAAVMPEPVAPPEPVAEPEPDDLTVLVGIGPKLSASLAERGLTRYAHIAALTPKKIATLDKQMKLMGRIERDAWVAQAKRLTTP
jgi:predicted flap endonuclease-1-like 5' DNA nuclease